MPKKPITQPIAPATLLPEFAGLTPAQEDIIVTLIEQGLGKVDLTIGPERRLNKTKLAEAAHVDRKTVLRAFQSEAFIAAYNKVCLFLIQERIGEVLEASIREAKRGSFQDRQMLLQMAGLYKPSSRTELTGKDGGPLELGIVGIVREAAHQPPPTPQLTAPQEGAAS